jgi:hypothetical protein
MSPKSTQRTTRTTKPEAYKPPNPFEIPEELSDYFAGQGYKLRFIRWQIDGKEDYKNIRDKAQRGYTPVLHKDLPVNANAYASTYDNASFGKYSGVITSGDLALCKIPTAQAEAIIDYFEEQAKLQRSPFKSDNKQMNRLAPVEDTSDTRTVTGKRKLNFGESTNTDNDE